MPLMLQVGFGYPAIIAGCMIAPTAIGSIIAKSTVTQVLRWFGYRKTLVGITVFIGLMIAQFSLQSPEMPLWMLLLPLFVLGMAMSTQFTAMNTITLADLTDDNASSGNSLLAVTQQLSISLGVAISAAVPERIMATSLRRMPVLMRLPRPPPPTEEANTAVPMALTAAMRTPVKIIGRARGSSTWRRR